MHVYNRTAVYSDLEQLFGIDQLLPRPSESAQELVAFILGSYQTSVRTGGVGNLHPRRPPTSTSTNTATEGN